jgi:Cu-processing system permease protein
MRNILVIAKNTFRETIRDRILYGILGFSLIYVAITYLLAKISLGDPVVLKSFGLAGIYFFGSIITIFLGASIIHKEIERRTLYFIFSKPVSRLQLILGKFFGLFAAVTMTILIMAFVYFEVIFYGGGGFDTPALLAIFFQILETGLLVALLVFFSTITTPLTSTIITVMMLFGGHSMSSVLRTAKEIGGPLYRFVQVVYYALPNLEKFDVRSAAAHQISISGTSVLITIAYAACYTALVLLFANFFLKRKEL